MKEPGWMKQVVDEAETPEMVAAERDALRAELDEIQRLLPECERDALQKRVRKLEGAEGMAKMLQAYTEQRKRIATLEQQLAAQIAENLPGREVMERIAVLEQQKARLVNALRSIENDKHNVGRRKKVDGEFLTRSSRLIALYEIAHNALDQLKTEDGGEQRRKRER